MQRRAWRVIHAVDSTASFCSLKPKACSLWHSGTNGFTSYTPAVQTSNSIFNTWAAATGAAITNTTQFGSYSTSAGLATITGGLTRPDYLFTNDITVGGFTIEAALRQNAAPNALLDIWRKCEPTNTITFLKAGRSIIRLRCARTLGKRAGSTLSLSSQVAMVKR